MKAIGMYKKLFGLLLATMTVLTLMGVFTRQRRDNIALISFLLAAGFLLVALCAASRQDMLQQQEANRLRHAADRKVAHLLENMSDAFLAVNREWVITYVNGQAEQLLRKPRAEMIGVNLWDVYPDAVETEFGEYYRRAFQEQVTVRFEAYYPAHSTWYQITAYPNENEEGLAIFFSDINERREAEAERNRLTQEAMLHAAAQRRNQELQDLARRLVEMQEAERRHLAHELHEEVGQILAGLKLSLASVAKQQDAAREFQLRIAQDLVTEVMRKVRALSLDLRPGVLDDLGLLPALEWYCKRYTEQTEVAVDFRANGLVTRLDGTVETTAYRILQEALANVARHSQVNAVEVRLTLQSELLTLQITDHGVGYSMENAHCFCDHSSLTGMQERAALIGGVFEVTTGTGQGTTILVRLPIHPVYTSLES